MVCQVWNGKPGVYWTLGLLGWHQCLRTRMIIWLNEQISTSSFQNLGQSLARSVEVIIAIKEGFHLEKDVQKAHIGVIVSVFIPVKLYSASIDFLDVLSWCTFDVPSARGLVKGWTCEGKGLGSCCMVGPAHTWCCLCTGELCKGQCSIMPAFYICWGTRGLWWRAKLDHLVQVSLLDICVRISWWLMWWALGVSELVLIPVHSAGTNCPHWVSLWGWDFMETGWLFGCCMSEGFLCIFCPWEELCPILLVHKVCMNPAISWFALSIWLRMGTLYQTH